MLSVFVVKYIKIQLCSVTLYTCDNPIHTLQAAKLNLVYPHYAWIIYSFYPDKWWTEEVAKEHLEECSDQKLEDFLLKSHALIIQLLPEPYDLNHKTITGLVKYDIMCVHLHCYNIYIGWQYCHFHSLKPA